MRFETKMSGGLVKVLLILAVFSWSKDAFVVDALHEEVVDSILAKLSRDFKNVDSQPEDFSFNTKKKLGQMDTTLSANLFMGRLVLEDMSRSSNVTYTEKGESPVRFEFTARLKAFFVYRYRFSVSTTAWSFGTAVGNWLSSLQLQIELGPEDCTLKLAKAQRSTAAFEVDIKPSDSFFFPATLHLSAGNALEKHLDRHASHVIETTINANKICDCITC